MLALFLTIQILPSHESHTKDELFISKTEEEIRVKAIYLVEG